MIGRLRRLLRDVAYPVYDCEDCIGMIQHGCQCSYYNAFYPGSGHVPWWARILRKLVLP